MRLSGVRKRYNREDNDRAEQTFECLCHVIWNKVLVDLEEQRSMEGSRNKIHLIRIIVQWCSALANEVSPQELFIVYFSKIDRYTSHAEIRRSVRTQDNRDVTWKDTRQLIGDWNAPERNSLKTSRSETLKPRTLYKSAWGVSASLVYAITRTVFQTACRILQSQRPEQSLAVSCCFAHH